MSTVLQLILFCYCFCPCVGIVFCCCIGSVAGSVVGSVTFWSVKRTVSDFILYQDLYLVLFEARQYS